MPAKCLVAREANVVVQIGQTRYTIQSNVIARRTTLDTSADNI